MEQFLNYLSSKIKFLGYIFNFKTNPLAVLDILIVAILFYWIYVMIKGTRGMRILIGIVILGISLGLSKIFQLYTVGWLLRQALTVTLVAIPIVFQPELRRALEKLGRAGFISELKGKEGKLEEVIEEIVEAVKIMSKNKIGSIIVIKRITGLDDYADLGVKIEGHLSKNLLLNLFFPNSPLHDGAVIIDGNKVIAASVMLPLAEGESTFSLGARHRAALGISSETDAVVIVTSEEKGGISLVYESQLFQKISADNLNRLLKKLLKLKKPLKTKRKGNNV